MKWTDEQIDVLNAIQAPIYSMFDSNVVIHIDAKAGTGKTTIIKEVVKRNPTKDYIYTAFNKKIVEDGTKVLDANKCKTFHALAYKYTSNPKIGGFYPSMIRTPGFSYADKKYVVDMLDKYCLSRYIDIEEFFEEIACPLRLENSIITYLEKMANRTIPITFNYMLKELHHQLNDGNISINLDMLFVDEAQDLTPVMLEIFGLIQADVKVYLGDTSQDIYSFLDLVSAFTLSTSTYNLTTSFRLSPAIAARIEPFCKTYIDPMFKLTGVGTGTDTNEGYITHSNAEIIYQVKLRQDKGLKYSFTRPIEEIFEVALTVHDILQGEKVNKPKYWSLVDKRKRGVPIKELVRDEELDDDILNSLRLIQKLNQQRVDIHKVLEQAKKDKPDRSYLVATAHSVKGLEMGCVTISRGLNSYVEVALNKTISTPQDEEERIEACKLYYVACSRAKHKLINATQLNI